MTEVGIKEYRNGDEERDWTISLTRVAGMLMIIGCHLSSWLGINTLAMILNVGVYVFLLISGMLYANRGIGNYQAFLRKRWAKLCIPMYYLLFALVGYMMLAHSTGIVKSIPIYLLNLQGIDFILPIKNMLHVTGMEHLWFLTIIELCYIAIVIVKYRKIDVHTTSVFLVFILLDVVLAFKGISLQYFLTFLIGYSMSKELKNTEKMKYAQISCCMVLAMVIRLLGRRYADGTILYDNIIVSFTHIVLAVWIYQTIALFFNLCPKASESLVKSRTMCWLEKMSLYLYMTHYMFLVGPFHISKMNVYKPIQILFFGVFTTLSAIILRLVSEKTVRIICE